MREIRIVIFISALFLLAYNSFADENEDLAKQAQNPIADLISLPFQNDINFNLGPNDRTQNVLNIQPVVPFNLTDKWNLITRTIVPLIYQPDVFSNSGGEFGLGDINTTLFLSPAKSSIVTWGLGPIISFPTATDNSLGTDKWSAGPSAVVLATPGPWVLGFLVSNIWSFAGNDNRADVNEFLLQYFVNYNFQGGWYLSSTPINTANWEEDSDNRWTIPIGGGPGKVFKVGKLPVNFRTQAYYNVEHPDLGPEWTLRLQLQFLFPKK